MKSEIDIVCYTGDSGLTDYSVSLARALAQRNSVNLVTSNRLEKQFQTMGFSTVLIFKRARHYVFGMAALVRRYRRRISQTILFQSWFLFPLVDALIARLLSAYGHKVFVTVHDTLPHHPWPWSKVVLGFFYRSFHGLIAHSENSKTALREMGVVCSILVVPHGIYDLFKTKDVSKDSARKALAVPSTPQTVVLLFGHIDQRKGCFEFLEVARRCQDLKNVHFVIAGRNDLSSNDRRRLDAYRSLPNITVKDQRIEFHDVQLFFFAADLVALPYLEGTTSGVYKLALAFSVPVLASEVGDLAEIARRGAAISIGSGSNLLGYFEAKIRILSKGPNSELLNVIQNIERETRISKWDVIAHSYLKLMNMNVGRI